MKAVISLIEHLLLLPTNEVCGFIAKRLSGLGFICSHDTYGNLVCIRGTGIMPGLVAHTDTVCVPERLHEVICTQDYMIGVDARGIQCGIGADDRAGIAGILQIATAYTGPLLTLFTADEEYGCLGASQLDLHTLSHCAYLIELDRHGYCDNHRPDVITHTNGVIVCSKGFKRQITPICKAHEYQFARGTCTDIGELKQRGLNLSCINMSIGYVREHTECEALHIRQYENALDTCMDILTTCGNKIFPHELPLKPERADIQSESYDSILVGYDSQYKPKIPRLGGRLRKSTKRIRHTAQRTF